jgi:hypothetical protein
MTDHPKNFMVTGWKDIPIGTVNTDLRFFTPKFKPAQSFHSHIETVVIDGVYHLKDRTETDCDEEDYYDCAKCRVKTCVDCLFVSRCYECGAGKLRE